MQAPQLLGRPEDLIKYSTSAEQSDSPILGGITAENTAETVADATPSMAFAKFVQESPLVKGAKGKIPSILRRTLPFVSMSTAGGKGVLPLLAFGAGYGVTRGLDKLSEKIPGMDGEGFTTKLARGMAPEVFEQAENTGSAFTTAPTLQALAEQRAGTTMTEDDAVDSLQSAIKAAGEQDSNLSPDALQATQPPVVPESVTSSDPNAGGGFTQPISPMQFIDRETGQPLDPTVVQAVQEAGLTDRLAQGAFPLPETPETPVSTPPMSVAETQQRLQERFGAPTLNQIQALPQGEGRGTAVDAQGRMASENRGEYNDASAEMQARIADRDRRPGESQTERDTRLAQGRTQQSVSAAGRKYTDSQLRRLFPNKDDYQGARVKDMNGIDPLTNTDYQDQELNRENVQSQIDERDRIDSDNPAQIIKDARAQAEAMAEASGLSPDDPEYNEYILDTISEITKIPRYIKPIPKYPNDDAADAAHAAGDLQEGADVNVNGKIGKYAPPEAEEVKGPHIVFARGRGGRARQDRRNQEDQ